MINYPLLSLCIPTYGVSEWVFPVLDSIYNQANDLTMFEVVVTDNGNNTKFKKKIREYAENKSNLSYFETNASSFVNEIESYKRAKGLFIKFINHRTILLPGTLDQFISFVKDNILDKPFVYFGNGLLPEVNGTRTCSTFNDFVEGLSYWSSWSTGMAFWKEDFDSIDENKDYNELFPHTDILFGFRNKSKYLINNQKLLEEMNDNGIPKGKYDLFYAFAVEYPSILLQLLRDGDLTLSSFKKIKDNNLFFIMEQYHAFVIKKRTCSYILDNYEECMNVFYSEDEIRECYRKLRIRQIINRLASFWKRGR